MKQKQQLHRDRFQRRWGVTELPAGIVEAKLCADGDALCCVLALADGTLAHGPLRLALDQAIADLRELCARQRTGGDAAVRAELQRRDVEAMTAHFARGLLG
uniref:Uncharacterized protein n=1 Tax=Pyrodinium bahamense TaxID=73915 RepID=A0A7S0FDC6_9DINO